MSRLNRPRTAAALAATAIALLLAALALDVRNFDRTSGGYEAPYTDFTGQPIDWSQAERTQTGFSRPGRVLGTELDCTTGMISFRALGVSREFRQVSERAIAVHKPREACRAAGWQPHF